MNLMIFPFLLMLSCQLHYMSYDEENNSNVINKLQNTIPKSQWVFSQKNFSHISLIISYKIEEYYNFFNSQLKC